MSTSETFTFDISACPCNGGRLVKRVTSYDNPWSGADVVILIDCPTCSIQWRVAHAMIVLRSSEATYHSALAAVRAARDAFEALALPLVENYLIEFAAPNKKALHTELTRLDLTCMSYRQFLEHLRKGRTASSAVTPNRNPSWLTSITRTQGVSDQLEKLTQALNSTEQACTQARQQIVRRRIQ